jgi:signal transduction histidine kinase
VGTDAGLAVYRDNHLVQDKILSVELPLPVVAIGEDASNSMLFSVEHGNVYSFADGVLKRLETGPSISAVPLQEVVSIFRDKDGNVWMTSSGFGVGLLSQGKLFRYFVRDGLFDTDNYGVVADAHDRLWFACSKGFYWVNRADLLEFAAGKRKKIVSSPYSPLDGLRTVQGIPGVQPAGVLASDGRLWFSASRGLLAFEADLGAQDVAPPPVVISKITANGAAVTPAQVEKLGPGQHNLVIEYSALSFLAPARMTYHYKLEGFDQDWTDAGSRRAAFYTNLPPGHYRFRATVCGEPTPCNTEGAFVDFAIAPALYQRSWFIPLCVAVIGLIAFAVYRLRVRQLRAQFVLVLGERSRIARELHDTLIQGFSGITMQMQAFTSRVRTPEDKQVLQEIIQDAGTCLRETRRSVAGLRGGAGAAGGLTEAIAEAARHLTEEREVRLRLNLDDGHVELPAEVKYNLVRIVQEAVSNAVKHAEARTVEVSLAYTSNALRVLIRDDGRGFSREQSSGEPGHYGIIGMKERALHIGAEFDLVSTPGAGTRISLVLPVTKDVPLTSAHKSVESVS